LSGFRIKREKAPPGSGARDDDSTVALVVPEPSVMRAAKPMPTTRVAKTSATAANLHVGKAAGGKQRKIIHDTLPSRGKRREPLAWCGSGGSS